jgi:SAM-dependent methyltransferase
VGLAAEDDWSARGGPLAFQIGLATFGILALELALIRWTAGQVRAFAYFNNLVLIAAFLGMGLGVALGRRRRGLVHWALPVLAPLAAILGLAEPLGLVRLAFPDPFVHTWGAEVVAGGAWRLLGSFAIFGALIAGVVAVFVCAGAAVGALFGRLPALAAYRWDLLGSLTGVLAMTLVSATGAGPAVWLALGVAPFMWLSRRPLSLAAGVLAVACGALSVRGAVYSPYNRIDVAENQGSYRLEVNRDFHQFIYDLSDARMKAGSGPEAYVRATYELPFVVNAARGAALVVGAGTGNDAAAALRNGYTRVVSVDIDPQIVALGRRLHPESPYADPRSEVVVDDARAYFQRHRTERFDAVVFGLLDSHAMFTALSSLRLDNYVYTEEGIRAAWEHVAPGGHLSVSFSVFAGPWIFDRLYWTIARATGRLPIAMKHGMQYGCTFLVPRDGARLDLGRAPFERVGPSAPLRTVRTTSDDWPFLYVRPGVFPWGYVTVLGTLLVFTLLASPRAFGRAALGADFDPVLFFMGAAFLLIETRGVTSLSLLFGSTWLVNSAVFAGILLMALAANEVVARRPPRRLHGWFAALLVSVVLLWAVPPSLLGSFDLATRGLAGGLVNGLPIAFAGVVVSTLLARSRNPAASLGSNLLGSVVGGCLEYLSMMVGLGALALLALVLYLIAMLYALRRGVADAPAGASGLEHAPVRSPDAI